MNKFEIGEEVILVSKSRPYLNGEYVVTDIHKSSDIVENPFGENYRLPNDIPGYVYCLESLSHQTPLEDGTQIEAYIHWLESSLRKKHKPSEFTFEELMVNLKAEVVEA